MLGRVALGVHDRLLQGEDVSVERAQCMPQRVSSARPVAVAGEEVHGSDPDPPLAHAGNASPPPDLWTGV
jgi:hypothetical protein